MPATAKEQPEQQRYSPTSGRRQYWIQDAVESGEAIAAMFLVAPQAWNDLVRIDKDSEVFEVGDLWFGLANYGTEEEEQSGAGSSESRFSFDTTGANEHITASKATVGAFAAAGEAAAVGDNGNLIGVGDGENAEGVDVPVPRLGFTVTKEFAIGSGTSDFIKALAKIGVNDGAVTITTDSGITIAANTGELLYMGATGGDKGAKLVVAYQVSFSPNVVGRSIGTIAGINAGGHEYVWTRNRHVVEQQRLTLKPLVAYVEQVFDLIDFSGLGL